MQKFDVVQAWLDQVAYSHSKSFNTSDCYRRSLETFTTYIGATPQNILDDYEHSDEKAFKKKYGQYVRAFIGALTQKNLTINTISATVGAIRSFFKYNDLPLGFVPIAHTRVVYHNRDITRDEIEKILETVAVRERAFFSMMAQSGLRPDTLCSLRLQYIQPDFKNDVIPCHIDVPEELTKGKYHAYHSFMSDDSVKALKAYFATRPNINEESYIFTNQGKEEQANPKSFSIIFMHTIRKLKATKKIDYKMGPAKKPAELRLYNLRKYFRKWAAPAGLENVQFWMGHTVKEGVDEHYRPKDIEYYRKAYKLAMPNLRLSSATPNETDKTITELRQEIDKSRDVIKLLKAELDNKYGNLEKMITEGMQDRNKQKTETEESWLAQFKTPEDLAKATEAMKNYRLELEAMNELAYRKHIQDVQARLAEGQKDSKKRSSNP